MADHDGHTIDVCPVKVGEPDPATDPKLIRVYDHPVDGRYLLGVDLVAWLRDLAETARGAESSPLSAVISGPLLDRMADSAEGWLDQDGAAVAVIEDTETPREDRHAAIPQPGSNVCVCGSVVDDTSAHLAEESPA